MIPKAARARLQNIKISKYLELRRLTEDDVFGECGRKPWRGDTLHAREPLTMSKNYNYHDFWFPYKNCRRGKIPCENYCALSWFLVTVVTNYHATITACYGGGWLPYKVFRGCQLPSANYCAIPWWLLTAANVTEMKNRYRGKPC